MRKIRGSKKNNNVPSLLDIIVVENNSQIVINSTKGQIDIPSLIINHDIDISNLIRNFNNVILVTIRGLKIVLLIILSKGLITLCNFSL